MTAAPRMSPLLLRIAEHERRADEALRRSGQAAVAGLTAVARAWRKQSTRHRQRAVELEQQLQEEQQR